MDLSTKEDGKLKLHTKQLSNPQCRLGISKGWSSPHQEHMDLSKTRLNCEKKGCSFKEEIRSLLMIMRVCKEE